MPSLVWFAFQLQRERGPTLIYCMHSRQAAQPRSFACILSFKSYFRLPIVQVRADSWQESDTLMRARVSHPGLDLLLSSSLDNNHIITQWLILRSVYNCLILLFLTVFSPICHFKTLSFVAFFARVYFYIFQELLIVEMTDNLFH